MGGWEIFKVSLHSILPTPCFFQILSVSSLPPTSHCSFCCHLSCFFGWMGDHATFDVLFYLMDPHTLSLGTLAPEDLDVCFMQQGVKFTEVWYIMWCGFLLVLWFDITHTQTQTQTAHSRASRLIHPYKYIFTPPVMWSLQLLLLH